MPIPFLALGPAEDRADIEAAIARVIDRGWFVLGPEVEAFEAEFAAACGARHAVGVNTGTDALMLSLRGLDIGPGDEVITTPLTAAYTALAIRMAGATPVFADIDQRCCTLNLQAVDAAITDRTRAIIPVHLYGQPAHMSGLLEIASHENIAVIEDCAQAHLATFEGRPVGTIGTVGAFSFYPTKNLGALGDGGAIVTNDAALAGRLRRLRNGGQSERYRHVENGVNSRLDEMQAAILRARLPRLAGWTARRRGLAARYRAALASDAVTVLPERDSGHVYHLFTVHSAYRDDLQRSLADKGIGTLVHYPTPVHRQPAFADLPRAHCPVADAVAAHVLSLPLHHQIGDDEVDQVADAVNQFMPSTRPASGAR